MIILILKFGSANIMWLAMTIMVPRGYGLLLAVHPEAQATKAWDCWSFLASLFARFGFETSDVGGAGEKPGNDGRLDEQLLIQADEEFGGQE